MGLAVDSITGAFSFFRNNLIIILYQLIFGIIFAVIFTVFIITISGNILDTLRTFNATSSPMVFNEVFSKSAVQLIVFEIIFILISIVQGAGFPVMVKQSKQGKVDIVDAISNSIKNIHRVIATGIIQELPVLLLLIPIAVIYFVT